MTHYHLVAYNYYNHNTKYTYNNDIILLVNWGACIQCQIIQSTKNCNNKIYNELLAEHGQMMH